MPFSLNPRTEAEVDGRRNGIADGTADQLLAR